MSVARNSVGPRHRGAGRSVTMAGAAGAAGAADGSGGGTSVRFRCGHGATATDARITLQRDCPLCMLLAETKRSRAQLLRKVVAGRRTLLSQETRIGAEYECICDRGHSRYLATVRAALTGSGCGCCWVSASVCRTGSTRCASAAPSTVSRRSGQARAPQHRLPGGVGEGRGPHPRASGGDPRDRRGGGSPDRLIV